MSIPKPPSTTSLSDLDIAKALFAPIRHAEPPSPTKHHIKISIIGTGNVGMAIAQTLLTQDLAGELALVDALPDKLRGEMLDLQHAAAFLPRTKIVASTDYAITTASDLCIVTAGARQLPDESRLNLLQRNVNLFKKIIPPLVKYSPGCILLIVSNPVDVLTYISWKLSGFPSNRVIGSGTNLDSSRFRFLIADHLDVNAQDVQGYTSWAVGYSVANLARAILRDQRSIHPVTVLSKGFHDIEDGEVFLSLPAQLGRGGVLGVVNVPISDEEADQLRKSATTILEVHEHLGV
ncbi:hypothetical protein KSS87_010064 [Heliosperma pusillum]|nr:hypothetical protein KSS87_010064 [Heliosperma pusillum]